MTCRAALLVVILLLSCNFAWADQKILFREDFRDLRNWEPLYFPKIERHTTYTTVSEGGRTYLKAQSQASASALVFKKTFDPYTTPRIRWRWKVDNVYQKWSGKEKSGDDYPIRIYVMFQYDPEQAGLSERLMYGAAKTLYGKYPPHSTLNYVWASGTNADDMIVSPFTDKARMIALEKGPARVGQWVDETAGIIDDYRKAFGKDPPKTASIAIMNDSDNTGEAAVSYVEFIEVSD
jgi:hypothetical protein